jgi:sodium-coupled neutral amino acid transporter 11
MSRAGFFMGLFLLVILSFVTDWTIRLIVVNAKLSGTKSYIGIMNRCFGSGGRAAVSFFQFSFAFGGTFVCQDILTRLLINHYRDVCFWNHHRYASVVFRVSFRCPILLPGDTIPHVIRSIFPHLGSVPVLWLFTDRRFIIVFTTIGVSYPLSLYRDIHKLSIASSFALCGMLIIVSSVMFEGRLVSPLLKGDPSKRFSFIEPGIFQAIGVISFAFVCHHNSLLIYGSLRTPTLNRFATVTHVSTIASFIACSIMAISGYVVFTDRTQGNILNNFSPVSPIPFYSGALIPI